MKRAAGLVGIVLAKAASGLAQQVPLISRGATVYAIFATE